MKLKSAKAVLGLVLVFLLGAITGSLAAYMIAKAHFDTFPHGGHHMKEEAVVHRLTQKLDLDQEQQNQVKSIIHETREKMRLIRQKTRPEMEALMNVSQARINALLRPSQQEKFNKMVEEYKARKQREHDEHRGGD